MNGRDSSLWGEPGLTEKQMKAHAASGPEGQAHGPMDSSASGSCDLQLTGRFNHTTHMLSTLPPLPGPASIGFTLLPRKAGPQE